MVLGMVPLTFAPVALTEDHLGGEQQATANQNL